MRAIFTGGRDFSDIDKVKKVIKAFNIDFAIVGDCPTGLDAIVRELFLGAHDMVIADWGTHGRAAGPIRNRKMLEKSRLDPLIAFSGNRGTQNCIKTALGMGMTVLEVK